MHVESECACAVNSMLRMFLCGQIKDAVTTRCAYAANSMLPMFLCGQIKDAVNTRCAYAANSMLPMFLCGQIKDAVKVLSHLYFFVVKQKTWVIATPLPTPYFL